MEWTKELSVCDPPTLFGTNIVDEQKKGLKWKNFMLQNVISLFFLENSQKKTLVMDTVQI